MRQFALFVAGVALFVALGTTVAESQNPPSLLIEEIKTTGALPPLPPLPKVGNAAAGKKLYQRCAGCHGQVPTHLMGLSEGVLMAAMQNVQSGTFTAPKIIQMQAMLNNMTQPQLADIAAYLSGLQN